MEDQMYITIAKVLHGEASEEERRELDAWIQSDKSHAAVFSEMQAAWSESDALFAEPAFDTAQAWQKVAARIHQPEVVELPRRSKTIALSSWIKYSSAVAAILLIALIVWNPFDRGDIRVTADKGNMSVELPDHSTVTLRKGSSLSYPESFAANERRVALKGEAFFEVSRNEQQAFIIDAQSVSVRVLGTSFNVSCSDESAEVAVSTGRVQVSPRNAPDRQVILTPGLSARYRDGVLSQGKASGHETSWKTGELSFNNVPLDQIVARIAEMTNVQVAFHNDFTPAQQQQAVTVSFRAQSVEDMLTELCLITNSRWEKSGDSYIIRRK